MDIEKIVKNIKRFDYSLIDIDEYLDGRDCKEFDSEWVKVYKQINRDAIPEDIRKQSDKYRQDVFIAIDEQLGVGELAECISDDIELLMYADFLKLRNNWFLRFVEKYEQGELPSGIL